MLLRHTLRASAAALVLLLPFAAACSGSASAESSSDVSSVTLRVGDTGWKVSSAVLKYAHLDDTPYKLKWSLFQGGDQQLQAIRAGALDVAYSSEIPPSSRPPTANRTSRSSPYNAVRPSTRKSSCPRARR